MGGAPRCSSFPGLRKQVLPPVPAKGYYAWERDEGLDVKKLTTAMLVLLMLVLLMLALFCGGCGGSASVAGENAGSGSGVEVELTAPGRRLSTRRAGSWPFTGFRRK